MSTWLKNFIRQIRYTLGFSDPIVKRRVDEFVTEREEKALREALAGPHDKHCQGRWGHNPDTGYYCCDTFAEDYVWGGGKRRRENHEHEHIPPGLTTDDGQMFHIEDPAIRALLELAVVSGKPVLAEWDDEQQKYILMDEDQTPQTMEEIEAMIAEAKADGDEIGSGIISMPTDLPEDFDHMSTFEEWLKAQTPPEVGDVARNIGVDTRYDDAISDETDEPDVEDEQDDLQAMAKDRMEDLKDDERRDMP